METFISKNGQLTWNVIDKESRQSDKRSNMYFTVACSKCGHKMVGQKGNIRAKVKCPGCSEKPVALKTDKAGGCITICEIGTVEFIRDFQEEHSVSEREAVRQFIETVKAHLPADDPIIDGLTEGSVSAKVRRATGKKKDKSVAVRHKNKDGADLQPNSRREPEQSTPKDKPGGCSELGQMEVEQDGSGYQLEPTLEAVQQFLDKHMPGHELHRKPVSCKACGNEGFIHGYFCQSCQARG